MVTCNRCGIRFKGGMVAYGDDCVDCQDVEGEARPSPWRVGGSTPTAEELKARDNDIIRMTLAGKTADQIARALGINSNTVSRYRTKLNVRNPSLSRRIYSTNAAPRRRDLDGEFALKVEADIARGYTATASANKHGVAISTILAWRRALENRET